MEHAYHAFNHPYERADPVRQRWWHALRIPTAWPRYRHSLGDAKPLSRRAGSLGPSVIDGLAISRPVILFNNAGVGASSGHTPDTIEEMAAQVAAFADALRLSLIDVLGFSIGGYVAQSLASNRPDLVRRLVLVGTGLRAGEPRTGARVAEVAANPVPTCEDFLFLFFAPSATSQSAGKAFWNRRHARTVDIDPPSPPQTTHAQSSAIALSAASRRALLGASGLIKTKESCPGFPAARLGAKMQNAHRYQHRRHGIRQNPS
jgi:pimeloyl-ACP methyl ester carboxylesterase